MIMAMMKDTMTQELTQKELMQHLLNVAQHTATREEVTAVRQELKDDIAKVRDELKADIADVRNEISSVRNELKADIAELRKTVDVKFNLLIMIMLGGFLSIITISLVKPLLA